MAKAVRKVDNKTSPHDNFLHEGTVMYEVESISERITDSRPRACRGMQEGRLLFTFGQGLDSAASVQTIHDDCIRSNDTAVRTWARASLCTTTIMRHMHLSDLQRSMMTLCSRDRSSWTESFEHMSLLG